METRYSSISMCEQDGSGREIGHGRSLLVAAIRASLVHQFNMLLWVFPAVLASTAVVSATDSTDVVDAALCDLVQRPLEFENRHVRVRGTAQAGPEFFGLAYDACPSENGTSGSIWLDLPAEDEIFMYSRGWSMKRFIQASRSGQLKGDGPSVAWQTPAPLTPLDQEQMESLYRALTKSHDGGVQAVIIGRFDFAGSGLLIKSRGGDFAFKSGFGHLNCCSRRIVLEHVEVAGDAK